MNDTYPYSTPQILNDTNFILYGGQSGTSSVAQRQVAYLLAEMQMTHHLDSFLIPTIITGTYFWKGSNPINLEMGHIINVNGVSIFSYDWADGCSIDSVTGCFAVRGDGKYGYVDVQALLNCGGCNTKSVRFPYNVQISFTSGLQTGTSLQPVILQGLVLAAQINLNEMDVSLSNEGTADVGIQSFSNMKYSEVRTRLGNSSFGNSPMANRIVRLVKRYRTKPSIGFH